MMKKLLIVGALAVAALALAPSADAAYTGCPTGAQNIASGASLSGLSGVLCLADGTYRGGISPPSNTQFWAAHYRAAIIDGGLSQTTAFSGSGTSVQLHGLVIKNFIPTRQHGAVDASGANWVVADTQITHNGDFYKSSTNLGGAGVHLNNATVTRSLLDHNGEEGYALGGVVTFTDNEVSFNNTSHQDWGFEAGGGKFWSTRPGTVITGNNVHDNDGPGLWIDSSSSYAANGYTMSNNVIDNNNGPGIDIEVSSAGTVSNNTTHHNGAYHSNSASWGSSEIDIAQSDGVTVTGNKMYGGAGLTVRDENRSGYPCACRLHATSNTTVHEVGWSNTFVSNANFPTVTGVYNSSGDTTNSWDYNTYVNVGTSAWFRWTGTMYNFAGWQSKGQDVHGSLSSVVPTASPSPSPSPSLSPSSSLPAPSPTNTMTLTCTRPSGGLWTCTQAN